MRVVERRNERETVVEVLGLYYIKAQGSKVLSLLDSYIEKKLIEEITPVLTKEYTEEHGPEIHFMNPMDIVTDGPNSAIDIFELRNKKE